MGLGIQWQVIVAFGLGILLLYITGYLLLLPFKTVLKLLGNALIGAAALALLNVFGAAIDLYIPLNPLTAIVAGYLGLPGVLLLVGTSYLLKVI